MSRLEDHVAFSGTRRGMAPAQRESVAGQFRVLRKTGLSWLHHGDCEGADHQAHDIWVSMGGLTHIHQALGVAGQVGCLGDRYELPQPPLLRNTVMVSASAVLVAAPLQEDEVVRSGTWATVRRARALGRTVVLCLPSGRVIHEPRGSEQLSLSL